MQRRKGLRYEDGGEVEVEEEAEEGGRWREVSRRGDAKTLAA